MRGSKLARRLKNASDEFRHCKSHCGFPVRSKPLATQSVLGEGLVHRTQSPEAFVNLPRAVQKERLRPGGRTHVFEFVLFAHYRLCRCNLVLARQPIRARWSHGPSTEFSDLVRRWRGDPAQIAALRSCPVLAEVWRNRSYALF
jgi:hypothetical protein